MNGQVVVGIGILFAVLVILPVMALPDVRLFSPTTQTRNAWVTLNNINGTGTPENVYVSYTMGVIPVHKHHSDVWDMSLLPSSF